jgi:5,10-methylenetetrahydrofolate reductase
MPEFREALRSDKFLVTVEATPPRGTNLDPFLKTLGAWAGKVDGVNLPDGRGATIHLSPVAAAVMARAKGLEPILTLSCRDRNRIALSSDLLGAHALGIRTVLCVSGDYFTCGDVQDAKPVYDLDSVQAIRMIRALEKGEDVGGNSLDGAPGFCVGCVANPQVEPLEPHLIKLEKKLEAGAEFIQTLDLYDFEKGRRFFEHLKSRAVKVLAGLRLLTHRELDAFRRGRVPGNRIPEAVVDEIQGAVSEEEGLKRARSRVVAMINAARESGLCHGVHLTVEGHESLIPEILQEVGIL